MDQVLFSEPSTKMRAKMDAIIAAKEVTENEKNIVKETTVINKDLVEENASADDPVDKFLNDRFGG